MVISEISSEGSHVASDEPFSSHEGSPEGSEKASGQGSRGLGPFLMLVLVWFTLSIHTMFPVLC